MATSAAAPPVMINTNKMRHLTSPCSGGLVAIPEVVALIEARWLSVASFSNCS